MRLTDHSKHNTRLSGSRLGNLLRGYTSLWCHVSAKSAVANADSSNWKRTSQGTVKKNPSLVTLKSSLSLTGMEWKKETQGLAYRNIDGWISNQVWILSKSMMSLSERHTRAATSYEAFRVIHISFQNVHSPNKIRRNEMGGLQVSIGSKQPKKLEFHFEAPCLGAVTTCGAATAPLIRPIQSATSSFCGWGVAAVLEAIMRLW